MEKRAGGKYIRIDMAATARVFSGSCSFSSQTAVKNTQTMMTARWVEGDIPDIIP